MELLLLADVLPEEDSSGIKVGKGGKLTTAEGAGSLLDDAAAAVAVGLAWFENRFQKPRVIPIDSVVIRILTSLNDFRFGLRLDIDDSFSIMKYVNGKMR